MDARAVTVEYATTFFERYTAAFDGQDWPGAVAFYNEPAFSVRADGTVRLLPSRAEATAFFQAVWDGYRAEGYSRFTLSDLQVLPMGGRSALVTFTWHLERADHSRIRSWRQSYQLILSGTKWLILASTLHAK